MANLNSASITITTDASQAIQGINQARGAFQGFEGAVQTTSGRMLDQWKKHWLAFSAAAVAAYATVSKAWDFAEQAAKYEQSRNAFRTMVQSMGMDASIEFEKIRQASAGLIDDKSLIESANKAMSLGIPIEKLGQLMTIARAKARDMGTDTAQAFNDIAIGVGRGSPLILDNLGLMLKLGSANEAMAKSLGKTVEQLTDKDKKMAILNATIDAGKEALDRHNLALLTNAERMQKVTATVENMKLQFGALIIRIGVGAVGLAEGVKSAFLMLAEAIVFPFALIEKGLNKLGIAGTFWNDTLKEQSRLLNESKTSMLDNFKAMVAKSSDLANAAGKIKKPLDDVATASADAAKKIADLNKQIQDLIDKSTLTPVALIEKQAETWRKAGANRVLIEKWTQMELEKLNLEYGKKIIEQNEQAEKQRMEDILANYDLEQRILEARSKKQMEFLDFELKIADIKKNSDVARLQFIGQENAALDLQFQQEAAIIAQRYNAVMQSEVSSDADKLTAKANFLEAEYQLELQYAQQKAELWWNGAQTYINFAQQMSTFAIQSLYAEGEERDAIQNRMLASAIRFLTQALQNYMFAKAKEHLINAMAAAGYLKLKTTQAVAEMAIGAQMATAWAAYFTAMSLNPLGGQAFIPAATAMAAAIAAFGVAGAGAAITGATSIASELAMAALWAAGGIAVGAGGEALAASQERQGKGGQITIGGEGGYTYTQPTTPTWEKTEEAKQGKTINITIHGNIIDHAAFVRELAPYINEAQGDNVLVLE